MSIVLSFMVYFASCAGKGKEVLTPAGNRALLHCTDLQWSEAGIEYSLEKHREVVWQSLKDVPGRNSLPPLLIHYDHHRHQVGLGALTGTTNRRTNNGCTAHVYVHPSCTEYSYSVHVCTNTSIYIHVVSLLYLSCYCAM